jgi:hypothetical protein
LSLEVTDTNIHRPGTLDRLPERGGRDQKGEGGERKRKRDQHVRLSSLTILRELQKITKDIHIGLAIISTRMLIAELGEIRRSGRENEGRGPSLRCQHFVRCQ